MIAPSVVSFMPDHFICGNTFRCVWALREYPTSTDEQAILRHLGEKDGVTLRIYTRQVTPAEEKRIIQNAANKNRMNSSNTNDLQQTVTAESNLQDVATLVATMHRNREPLLHCAVYIELTASDYNSLKLLQTDVLTELVRSKLNVDKLLLRQQSPLGQSIQVDEKGVACKGGHTAIGRVSRSGGTHRLNLPPALARPVQKVGKLPGLPAQRADAIGRRQGKNRQQNAG